MEKDIQQIDDALMAAISGGTSEETEEIANYLIEHDPEFTAMMADDYYLAIYLRLKHHVPEMTTFFLRLRDPNGYITDGGSKLVSHEYIMDQLRKKLG